MEIAIKSTLEEARKIEEQISAILAALEKDESIMEATLLQLPTSPGSGRRKDSLKKSNDIRRKSSEEEMDAEEIRVTVPKKRPEGRKNIYELEESSIFLLPVQEEWVFGMTLNNVSGKPQPFPELVLNLLPQKKEVVDKPCKVFHYRVQVHALDVKYGAALQNRNVGDGIPFHNSFHPSSSSKSEKKTLIQPGCQVLTTASFQSPIHFLDKNKLSLLVSLMLNGSELWSRIVPISLDNLTAVQQSENTFLLHQSSILMALGRHQEYFKLNRLLSHGDKSPHRAVEKFLVRSGFEKISDGEPLGVDRVVDVFASTKSNISPLWGALFKVEKCNRNVSTVNCVLSARSTQQYQMFMRLFQNWLRKEGREERSKGMTGISVLPMITPAEDKNVLKTIQNEINVINDLIDGRRKRQTKTGNRTHSAWLNDFIDVVSATDDVFMNHLCLS